MTRPHGQGDLGVGLRCIKCLLLAFNVLFVLSGILLVLTAFIVAMPLSQLTPLLQRQFLSPGLLLGAVGVAVIVVACLGMWGAMRQSTALVTLFSFMLSVLLVLELGAGLSAFLLQNDVRNVLYENIATAMMRFDEDLATRHAVNKMQTAFKCCGVESPTNWQQVQGYEFSPPASCCAALQRSRNSSIVTECAYEQVLDEVPGCLIEMGRLVVQGSAFIAMSAVVTAFTQFLGILFACTLGRSIRQQKTLRDLRRNQLRNNLINSYTPLDTKPMPPITITY